MKSVSQLLDIAKAKIGTKSDRELARRLKITTVTHYRKRAVIPDDETAFKLAELCEIDPKEVLLTCHLWRIQQGGQVRDAWGQIFKKVVGAVLMAASIAATFPATAAAAACSPAAMQYYTLCDVIRRLITRRFTPQRFAAM